MAFSGSAASRCLAFPDHLQPPPLFSIIRVAGHDKIAHDDTPPPAAAAAAAAGAAAAATTTNDNTAAATVAAPLNPSQASSPASPPTQSEHFGAGSGSDKHGSIASTFSRPADSVAPPGARNSCAGPPALNLNPSYPVHPIQSMRGPFNESIMEAMDHNEPDRRIRNTLDAASRRLQLLELADDKLAQEHTSRWRQKPNAKFHPLWKLIAQISFGIHLLHSQTAKSEEEVINILQTHVDDIDGFLEDTTLDFDIALRDITERGHYLRMPLRNRRVFDKMLRSHEFRLSIIEGNDIIERIILRTRHAQSKAMDDVSKGLNATAELAKYLERLGKEWTDRNEDMQGVYTAMKGNAEGWYCCFGDIEQKSQRLNDMMQELEGTINEIARRAGIASRKRARQSIRDENRGQKQEDSAGSKTPSAAAANSRNSLNKPLPPDPLRTARHTEVRPGSPAKISRSPKTPSGESTYPRELIFFPSQEPLPDDSRDDKARNGKVPGEMGGMEANAEDHPFSLSNAMPSPLPPLSRTSPPDPKPPEVDACPPLTQTQSSGSLDGNNARMPSPLPERNRVSASYASPVRSQRHSREQHDVSNAPKGSHDAATTPSRSDTVNVRATQSTFNNSRFADSMEVQRAPEMSKRTHFRAVSMDSARPRFYEESKGVAGSREATEPRDEPTPSQIANSMNGLQLGVGNEKNTAKASDSVVVTALPQYPEAETSNQAKKSHKGFKKPSMSALRGIICQKTPTRSASSDDLTTVKLRIDDDGRR